MTSPLVVVTGASSGIGRALTLALVEDGHHVLAVARRRDQLLELSDRAPDAIAPCVADVADPRGAEAVLAAVDASGSPLLGLVNVAGFLEALSPTTPFDEAVQMWESVIGANLTGAFLVAHALQPRLASPGRIVHVSSIAAFTGGSGAGATAYAAAKSGLLGLARAQARGLGPRGVTVNVVAPGFIADTGFTGGWPDSRVEGIVAQTPLGRPGHTDDIVGAVRYLLGPDSGFVTGQVLHVNGGWHFGG